MNDASGAVHYCYRALVAQENRDGGQAAQWLATGIALHERRTPAAKPLLAVAAAVPKLTDATTTASRPRGGRHHDRVALYRGL